jgi:hypothetical protein
VVGDQVSTIGIKLKQCFLAAQFASAGRFSDRYFLHEGSMQVEPEINGLKQGISAAFCWRAISAATHNHVHLGSDLVSVTPRQPNAMLRQLWEQVGARVAKTNFGRPSHDFRKFRDLLVVPSQQVVLRSYPGFRRKPCAMESAMPN